MIRITETDGFELPWTISEIRVFEPPKVHSWRFETIITTCPFYKLELA